MKYIDNKSTRNFWCMVIGKGVYSLTGASAEEESKQFLAEQKLQEYAISREILQGLSDGECHVIEVGLV